MYTIVLIDELTTQRKVLDGAESYGEAIALQTQWQMEYFDEGLSVEIEED